MKETCVCQVSRREGNEGTVLSTEFQLGTEKRA